MEEITKDSCRIAIFGGSFDPPHKGHFEVAAIAIKELKLDKLIFVPTSINPFKKEKKPILGRYRVDMLLAELGDSPNYLVSDIEIKKKGVSYSIDTIRKLKFNYKKAKLFLLIGSDNLALFSKWKDYKEILKLTKLVIFARGENANPKLLKEYNCILLKQSVGVFSSTKVKQGHLHHCTKKVRDFICSKRLYLKEILANTLSQYRFNHCIKTAVIAKRLASQNSICRRNSYLAGLLHDFSKEWSDEKHREFLISQGKNIKKIPSYQYHQLTASLWLEHVYGLRVKSVLRAISLHTSLAKRLTKLDKIVFIADKISKLPEREIEDYLKKDLATTFEEVVAKNLAELREKGIKLSLEQEQIYNQILRKK